ncbi:hypothetical protein FHS10_005896 [Mucilaginibacter dorajii]|nr:hypothetical protein [Mucilaginibacter dorajii]MCS3737923.1 hypothetical protein [Mucilaginibacter dorajii]
MSGKRFKQMAYICISNIIINNYKRWLKSPYITTTIGHLPFPDKSFDL